MTHLVFPVTSHSNTQQNCYVETNPEKFPDPESEFAAKKLKRSDYSCIYFSYPHNKMFLMIHDYAPDLTTAIDHDFDLWKNILRCEYPIAFKKISISERNILKKIRKLLKPEIKKIIIIYDGHGRGTPESVYPLVSDNFTHDQLVECIESVQTLDFYAIGYDCCNYIQESKSTSGSFSNINPGLS